MTKPGPRNVAWIPLVLLAVAGACSSSGTPRGGSGGSGEGGDDGSGTGGVSATGGRKGGTGGGGGGANPTGGATGTGGGGAGAGGSDNTGGSGPGGSGGGGGSATGGSGGSGPPPAGYKFGAHPQMYPAGALRPMGDQKGLDAAVATAYDKWKAAYVKMNCGGFVVATTHGEMGEITSSAALGRGMIFAAMMAGHDADAQKLFDGLYAVGRAKHSIYKGNEALLAYSVGANCTVPADDGSIFAGDGDFAFALLLADKQWGSAGAIKYADEAVKTIAAMKKFDMNSKLMLPLDGDWASLPGEAEKGWYTDTQPGNFLFGNFRAFATAAKDPFWMDTVGTLHGIVDTMQTMYSPKGFLPQFLDEGKPAADGKYAIAFDDKAHAGEFGGNAVMTVFRLAAEYAVSGDAKAKAEMGKLSGAVKMITAGDPSKIVDGYLLSGMPFGTKGTPNFFGPFGAAAAFAEDQAWLDKLWQLMVTSSTTGVDSETDSANLLGMLVASGNWWGP